MLRSPQGRLTLRQSADSQEEFEMESNVINSHNNTAQNSSNITFKCSTCPKKTFKHSIDVKTHLFDVHVQFTHYTVYCMIYDQ